MNRVNREAEYVYNAISELNILKSNFLNPGSIEDVRVDRIVSILKKALGESEFSTIMV